MSIFNLIFKIRKKMSEYYFAMVREAEKDYERKVEMSEWWASVEQEEAEKELKTNIECVTNDFSQWFGTLRARISYLKDFTKPPKNAEKVFQQLNELCKEVENVVKASNKELLEKYYYEFLEMPF